MLKFKIHHKRSIFSILIHLFNALKITANFILNLNDLIINLNYNHHMFNIFKKVYFSTNIKQKLIQNSLAYVPKYGWNQKAIHAACKTLDLSPAAHKIITPYALIVHSMRNWNEKALRIIDETNFEDRKRIREKIAYSIKVRLEQQNQFLDTWHEAMGIGALPENIATTKDLLWQYSDEVWRRCGDKTTDYNYYTKRILFNTAYASTEIYMLTDQSSNHFATWQFLERRLDNIETAGKAVADLKVVSQALGNGVLSLFTMFKTPQKYQAPIENVKIHEKDQLKQSENKMKVEEVSINDLQKDRPSQQLIKS